MTQLISLPVLTAGKAGSASKQRSRPNVREYYESPTDYVALQRLPITLNELARLKRQRVWYLERDSGYLLTGGAFAKDATNAKMLKSQGKQGWHGAIMHLLPHEGAGFGNICPDAEPGCIASCLNTAGQGTYPAVQAGRYKRTRWFFEQRASFLDWVAYEIASYRKWCHEEDKKPSVRLNGTSDIAWEKVAPWFFTTFSDVQFYDYTKTAKRVSAALPSNYDLTFSRSGTNEKEALELLAQGYRVAVVFSQRAPMPSEWHGFTVISGDDYDFRYLDPQGIVLGLVAKGSGRSDTSGFVVRDNEVA